MGLLDRLRHAFGSPAAAPIDPSHGLLGRFPDTAVAGVPVDEALYTMFPAIPRDDLRILVVFLRLGARETAHRELSDGEVARGMQALAPAHARGELQVRRAGSEWQLWQAEGR